MRPAGRSQACWRSMARGRATGSQGTTAHYGWKAGPGPIRACSAATLRQKPRDPCWVLRLPCFPNEQSAPLAVHGWRHVQAQHDRPRSFGNRVGPVGYRPATASGSCRRRSRPGGATLPGGRGGARRRKPGSRLKLLPVPCRQVRLRRQILQFARRLLTPLRTPPVFQLLE